MAKGFWRVDLGRVVGGVEAVDLQAARSVQDEDLEDGLAEAEPGWAVSLGEAADEKVERLDVVAVEVAQLGDGFRAVRQALEASDRFEIQGASELVVAWNASLAVARAVHCGEVERRNARPGFG